MPASAQDDFLSITGLEKIYPSRAGAILAIKDVNLCVGTAEFVSLLGPSGCGKSTLLRCVAGLELPTAGRIVLRGSTVTAPRPTAPMKVPIIERVTVVSAKKSAPVRKSTGRPSTK